MMATSVTGEKKKVSESAEVKCTRLINKGRPGERPCGKTIKDEGDFCRTCAPRVKPNGLPEPTINGLPTASIPKKGAVKKGAVKGGPLNGELLPIQGERTLNARTYDDPTKVDWCVELTYDLVFRNADPPCAFARLVDGQLLPLTEEDEKMAGHFGLTIGQFDEYVTDN